MISSAHRPTCSSMSSMPTSRHETLWLCCSPRLTSPSLSFLPPLYLSSPPDMEEKLQVEDARHRTQNFDTVLLLPIRLIARRHLLPPMTSSPSCSHSTTSTKKSDSEEPSMPAVSSVSSFTLVEPVLSATIPAISIAATRPAASFSPANRMQGLEAWRYARWGWESLTAQGLLLTSRASCSLILGSTSGKRMRKDALSLPR
mmetsp:Transcript_32700/g.103519  ORF Transcript_32700/g.103519 Transcript_32700/m.103519 type:complete len:201 (+) Transcript_32700:995-1597(+)